MQSHKFRVKTAPAGQPITLARAKAHLHELADDQDTLIEEQYIPAAVQLCEEYLLRALVKQTLELSLDDFPRCGGPIYLARPPLLQVDSLEYKDTDGAWQTMDASDYQVDDMDQPPAIYPAATETWPATESGAINAVKVTYKAGYSDLASSPVDYSENVPRPILNAILMVLSDLYQHREDIVVGTITNNIPLTAQHLMNPYRVFPV